MKKTALIFMSCLLCACSPSAPSVPSPSPSAAPVSSPVPSASSEAEATQIPEVIEAEEIEAVLEEELPMSLRVTIQDLETVFTKDLNYHCEDDLQVSDYIVIRYTGEIDRNPTALSAEKKK